MKAQLPWDIGEARDALAASSAGQHAAENAMKEAVKTFAIAEEAYRKALALTITNVHADGAAWTVAQDLARGDAHVASLRRTRDIAEGVKEAMVQAGWRASADRRDAQALAEWSMRRQFAEGGEGPVSLSERVRRAA